MNDFRTRLTMAFRELRRAGYFARKNWQCCQSCGCAAIPDDKSDKYVFYHNQDEKRLSQDKGTYLAWSGDGVEIRRILEKYELEVDWDGSPNTRIWVGEPEPKPVPSADEIYADQLHYFLSH